MKQKMILTVCLAVQNTAQAVSSPQRFLLPTCRKSHRMGVDDGIYGKQILEVCNKRIMSINGIQPINDATQLGIYLIRQNLSVRYPVVRHLTGQNRNGGEASVPNPGVMSKKVSQRCYTHKPTAENQMLFKTKLMCNVVLDTSVAEIAEKLGQCSQGCDFDCFPSRGEFLFSVFLVVACYELFLRPLQFSVQRFQMTGEKGMVRKQVGIDEPERIVAERKVMYHLCTDSNFYRLYGRKKKRPQLFIEVIILNDIVEMAVGEKLVIYAICLQWTPVICQPEITDKAQRIFCLCFIVNDKPSLFQKSNLLSDSNRVLAVVHKTYRNAKSHPVALLLRGRVVGTVGAKVGNSSVTSKHFERNLSDSTRKVA